MNTTEKLLEVLECSYRAYDNYRHKEFIMYCESVADRYRMSLSALTKHDGLMNWHQDMWLIHVEKKFVSENKDYIQAGVMDFEISEQLIHDYALEIQHMEPRALIEMIQHEQQIELPVLWVKASQKA